MALLARPIRYIVSGLPTPNSATAGRRPLTPRTTTQVRLFKQLLDKRTGALLVLPHDRRQVLFIYLRIDTRRMQAAMSQQISHIRERHPWLMNVHANTALCFSPVLYLYQYYLQLAGSHRTSDGTEHRVNPRRRQCERRFQSENR